MSQRALNRLSVPTNREINALAKRVEELSRNVASATKCKASAESVSQACEDCEEVQKGLRLREGAAAAGCSLSAQDGGSRAIEHLRFCAAVARTSVVGSKCLTT